MERLYFVSLLSAVVVILSPVWVNVDAAAGIGLDGITGVVHPETGAHLNFGSIGNYSNKIYFTDPNLTLNYDKSITFCKDNFMELVSINGTGATAVNEFNYLISVIPQSTDYYWVWSKASINFKWESTGEQAGFPRIYTGSTHPICLAISTNINDGFVSLHCCLNCRNIPLCQLVR